MTFELLEFRFEFQALDQLWFPSGKTGCTPTTPSLSRTARAMPAASAARAFKIQIVAARHAVHGHPDLAAVCVRERAEVKAVLLRLRAGEDHVAEAASGLQH